MKVKAKKIIQVFLNSLKKGFSFFKKHYVKIGFYLLVFMLFINTIFMTLYLLNRNYSYRILNTLYIEAILPDQDINNTLVTGIIKIEEIDYDTITDNQRVVFCCDYGLSENWVQDIVSINRNQKTLETTYDGVVTTIVDEDEAYGVYIEEANFIGTLYYTSSFVRGYILILISEVIFIYIYHYVFIQKKLNNVLSKSKVSESDEENENS